MLALEFGARDVFNPAALLLGCFTMIVCLLFQAYIINLAINFVPRIAAQLRGFDERIIAQFKFLLGALILVLTHIAQIYIWGTSLRLAGVIGDLNAAVIFAGSTYTTMSFVSDPLPPNWQLITIIMAASGLFSFGWSTSIMFVLAQRLFPIRLSPQSETAR